MKTKLFLILGAAVALMGLVGGATLALFTDSAQSTNEFTAAKLCITHIRDYGDPDVGPMFYVTAPAIDWVNATGYWSPGDSWTRVMNVKNDPGCSDVDAYLDRVSAKLTSGEEPTVGQKAFAGLFKVMITDMGGNKLVPEGITLKDLLLGSVPLRKSGGVKLLLGLNTTQNLHYTVTFDEGADNDFQGQELIVDFTVVAEQKDHNP